MNFSTQHLRNIFAETSYDSAKNLSDQINNAGFSAKVVRELK